ncbi:MAG: undecaprenyl-phosphate glucose phosphotransferase [Polyangiaceae bacterium]
MLKRYQNFVGGLFRVADVGIIVAAWLVSYWLRFHVPLFAVTKGLPGFGIYVSMAPLVAVLWFAVFAVMEVYESARMLGLGREMQRVMNAHGTALLIFVALTYAFEEYKYSRLVMAYFGVISAGALLTFRLFMRSALRMIRKRGFNSRHVLLVGEGTSVQALIQRFEEFPELGLRVRGVVTQVGSERTSVDGIPVLGAYGQIRNVLANVRVDEVLIALPSSQNHELSRLLELLKDETVDVRLVPDVRPYATLGCDVEDFNGVPVVRINGSPLSSGWGALAKRVTDVILSSIGLLVLAPLLLLIGLIIKLTTGGPVLFSQERMGLDGRTFRMLKFCSMRPDAESSTGAVWARPGDTRCTAVGALLRKTSLDELPQLWNVLCGDMALVGPRPERPVFVQKFRHEVPHYMLRHKVKAGITGWAQVNGWRGNTSLNSRIECDLYYIQHWSYALDLKILTLTLWKGFVNKNAY